MGKQENQKLRNFPSTSTEDGNGRVAEMGSPRELMDRGGLYRRMVELQRQSAQWRLK